MDLLRLWDDPETQFLDQFPFQESRDLSYHWKKNPGRHSQLPIEHKWKNTQITFNTNPEIFLNHSIDSILLPRGSSMIRFRIPAGRYRLHTKLGFLGNRQKFQESGVLTIISNGKEIMKWQGKSPEVWEEFEIQNSFGNDLIFQWESKESVCFVGEPRLVSLEAEEIMTNSPNVILIVIDSARKDFYGSYGRKVFLDEGTGLSIPSLTPNQDEIAKESLFFENPVANGNWTKPSMISLFHSDYASNLGLGNSWFTTKAYQRQVYYGKTRETIVSQLRQKQYYTKTIMNNVFFLDYTTVGVDLGFHDSYQVGMDVVDTEELASEALRFLRKKSHRPFFLHWNLNTPHGSYSPPNEMLRKVREILPAETTAKWEPAVLRYAGEIYFTDQVVGRIVEELKNQKIYDNTWIIVTGDHGELFSKHHDYSAHFILQGRFGHGETHYDEEIQVPFFIKPPRNQQEEMKNRKVRGVSSLLDLAPTLFGWMGIPYNQFRGMDYSKYAKGLDSAPKEIPAFTEGRMSESIRTNEWKYIRRYPGFTKVRRTIEGIPEDAEEELYNTKKDPSEMRNLARDRAEIASGFRSQIRQGKYLKRNSWNLWLPPCTERCTYEADLNLEGSLYDWQDSKGFTVTPFSAKNVHLQATPGKEGSLIKLFLVNPEFGFKLQLRNQGRPEMVRHGAFGTRFSHTELSLSQGEPIGLRTSQEPWVWIDPSWALGKTSETQKEMGKEVKKILETWGYIHE